jgi:adenylate cyclase
VLSNTMLSDTTSNAGAPDRFPTIPLLAVLAAIAGLVALFFAPVRAQLAGIEYWTADWRTALLADRTPGTHDKIAVVVFNSDTFGGATVTPIPRDLHAQVLRAVDGMGPSAIGTDFYFLASQGDEKDGAFLSAVRDVKTPLVLGAVDGRTKEFTPGQLAYQDTFLARAGRPAGYLSLKYDHGNVVRSMSPPLAGSPFTESFARAVASAAGASLADVSPAERIAWLAGPDPSVQPFLTIPAQDVLSTDAEKRRAVKDLLRGRFVLTGIDMPNQDRHETALSVRTEERMLGVMIHAHMLAQILDGRHFRELAGARLALLLATVGLIGFGLSWLFWRRKLDFLSLSVATAVLVALDVASYSTLRIVLPFTLLTCVWFIGVTAGHNMRALVAWARARQTSERAT